VLDLAFRLARSPRRRWLGREGAATLAAIADEADPSRPEALQLHEAVAELASELADHELGLARWGPGRRPDQSVRVARAALAAAKEAYYLGRSALAREWIARGRTTADRETTTEIDVLEALIEMWLAHRPGRGWELARRALAGARELAAEMGGSDGLPVEARTVHLSALEAAATVALQTEAWEALRQLVGAFLSAAASDEGTYVDALIWKAISLRIDGHFRDALDPLRTAWATANRLVLPPGPSTRVTGWPRPSRTSATSQRRSASHRRRLRWPHGWAITPASACVPDRSFTSWRSSGVTGELRVPLSWRRRSKSMTRTQGSRSTRCSPRGSRCWVGGPRLQQ
jgi:hypothetical protein